jgi:hypothetical protein
VLNLKVGGPNPGTDFDQLSISGPAALGGTLNVTLLYFVPASGATFQIVTFASRGSSIFSTANLDPSFKPLIYHDMDVTVMAL